MLSMFVSHLRFIVRQGKTFALVILHPILVALLLYPILSGLDEPNLRIALANLSPELSTVGLQLDRLAKSVEQFDSEDGVKKAVMLGKADVGVVVQEGEGKPVLKIYYNPLRFTSANLVRIHVQNAIVRLASENISTVEDWQVTLRSELANINKTLVRVRKGISSVKELAMEVNSEIPEPEKYTDYVEKIGEYEKVIAEYRSKIDSYREDIQEYIEELKEIEDALEDAETAQNSVLRQIDEVRANIDRQVDALQDAVYLIQNVIYTLDPSDPRTSDLQEALGSVYVTEQYLAELSMELDEMKAKITEYSVSKYLSKVRSARKRLEKLDRDLARLKERLQKTETELHKTRDELNSMIAELSENVDSLREFFSSLAGFSSDVEEGIDNLIKRISRFGGLHIGVLPGMVLKSVIQVKNTGQTYFPFILALDTLMVAFLLPVVMRHRERDQGVETRLRAMGVSPATIVVGRFMAYLLLVWAQAMLIVLFGYVAGYVEPSQLQETAAGVLAVTAFFLTIGTFVAHAVPNAVAAFMAIILLEIVFVMFSGRLIPIDLMSPTLKDIASITPLGIASILLESLMLGGFTPTAILVEMGIVGAVLIAGTVKILDQTPATL